MKKYFYTLFVLTTCSIAVAQSVLELGFKPESKPAVAAEVSADVPEKVVEGEKTTTSEEATPVADEAEEPTTKEESPVVTDEVANSVTNEVKAAANKPKKLTGRPARITSKHTVYNRKEGIASFEGNVYVDDEQYQMHADRVFLFMEGTNELKRIVAMGNVAMTNETRRAYAAKATYSKKNGLVVLYSGDGITAEVRDESKKQDQVVRGSRIRFWIGTEQVEVDDADLTGAAPGGGASSLKKVLGR